MVYSALLDQPSILGAALNGLSVRNTVIQNNIANVDTPDFKKSAVHFEGALQKALNKAKITGELDLSSVRPAITKIHENFSYRIDGNNVDIELEMVDLYQNQIKFEALVGGINNYYRRINSVFQLRM
jgi:flagellar basal-body rod protein FlgB